MNILIIAEGVCSILNLILTNKETLVAEVKMTEILEAQEMTAPF